MCLMLLVACVSVNAMGLFTDNFDTKVDPAVWTQLNPTNAIVWDGTRNAAGAAGSGCALPQGPPAGSASRMWHAIPEFTTPFMFTVWYYDDGTNISSFADIEGRNGSIPGGALQRQYCIGVWDTINFPGDPTTVDRTKYQGRVIYPAGGWVNLNGRGAVSRSVGWHKLQIERAYNGDVNYYVDDIICRTIPAFPEDRIVNLVFVGSVGNGVIAYDGVVVDKYETEAANIPAKVTNVSPANNSTEQPFNAPGVTLTWTAGTPAGASYDVYLGTVSDLVTMDRKSHTQAGTTYVTGALSPSTTYYWRADALDTNGHAMKGDTWKFMTTGPGAYFTPTASPTAGGTVTGYGKYEAGTSVPVTATRKPGYMFKKWSSDTAGSDTLSWSTSFNYTMPVGNKTIYAIFLPVNDDLVIEAWTNAGNQGYHPEWYTALGFELMGAKSSAPGLIAPACQYSGTGSGVGRAATYAPDITLAGDYKVYVTWASSAFGASQITHEVNYSGGQNIQILNQFWTSGLMNQWNLLGTFPFAVGTGGNLRQYASVVEASMRIIADAAKFVYVGPPKAINPSPADATAHIALTGTTLGWDSGGNTVSYDVYFGTNPTSLPKVSTRPLFDADNERTFATGPLAEATVYYWRIDSFNGATTTGDVWAFVSQGPAGANYLWLRPNPADKGSCTGAGYYPPSPPTVHIVATPVANYDFAKWTTDIGGSSVVSTSADYYYTMPGTDTTLYAQFVGHPYSLTLTANPTAGGTLTGAGGMPFGTSVTVEATTNSGYYFMNWTDDAGAVKSRKASYTFTMPGNDYHLNANYVKAIFAEGFEGLVTGSLDMNDPQGPNQATNGDLTSGQPWWGTSPSNGFVGVVSGLTAHSGPNALWDGGSRNGRDYVNLAYRCNGGLWYADNIYADWWFYDRSGQAWTLGGAASNYADDPFSLVYNAGLPSSADYPSGYESGSGQNFTDDQFDQKISLGMCDWWTPNRAGPGPYPIYPAVGDIPGFEHEKYQARIKSGSVPNQISFGNGWYNVDLARSVGWHHGRITVGAGTVQTEVNFYIDDMSTSLLTGVADAVGFNAIELMTEWKNGASVSADTDVLNWPKGTMYDDIVIGTMPQATPAAAPGAAAASAITASSITWNWTWNEANPVDGFHLFSLAALGVQTGNATPGTSRSFNETGLAANTPYDRWVSAYFAPVPPNVTFESAKTALTSQAPHIPVYTWAAKPVYGATGAAAVSCNLGASGIRTPGASVVFTAVNGFGTGAAKANSYKYVWDSLATDPLAPAWAAASSWVSGTLTFTPSSPGAYYLHLRAVNFDGAVNTNTTTFGPYYIDVSSIKTWAACGFYPYGGTTAVVGNPRFSDDMFVPDGTEPTMYASVGKTYNGKSWISYTSPDPIVDFDLVWGGANTYGDSYLFTYILNGGSAITDAYLSAGTDDGIKAWVNGNLVLAHDIYRPMAVNADISDGGQMPYTGVPTPFTLNPGVNRLLIKETQGTSLESAQARLCAADKSEPAWLSQITYVASDDAAPTGSIVIDQGATTTNPNVHLTLSASDTLSGLASMSFSNDNSTWTAAEPFAAGKDWVLSAPGPNTVYVKYADNARNTSTYNASIAYSDATPVAKISDLWGLPDGNYKLSGKTVTGAVGGAFWIEETDRSAAIKVIGSATQGRKVDVTGALSTIAGQRVLTAILVEDKGAGDTINPLGVIEKSAGGKGGSGNPSITDGVGLYNIGILVRIAGTAGNSNTADPLNKYFYLDDGSGLVDGAIAGIKVLCGSVAPPTSGNKTVTGLVGVVGGKPVLIIRGSGDIL